MKVVVRIQRVMEGGGPVKAVLTVEYGGLAVHGCRLVELAGGRLMLAFPCKKTGGRRWDTVHPVRESLRRQMEKEAVRAYEKVQKGDWGGLDPCGSGDIVLHDDHTRDGGGLGGDDSRLSGADGDCGKGDDDR